MTLKILILSQDGDGLGIAQKLSKEGNQVKMYTKDPRFREAGSGMLEPVDSWRPNISWADMIICDMVGFGKHEELFRSRGKVVFGCNSIMDMAELDRKKGIELFERFSIPTPETYSFDSPDDAQSISALWEDPGFVIKPSGNTDTSKTYVCHNPDIYKWALENIPPTSKLIVQKIVTGVEVSTEGWFNGRDWIKPFNHTFEEKRLFDGDKGPNTGCMGNLVISTEGDKLVESTVKKLTPFLKQINYRGPVDINCIIDGDSIYALEFTARLGYDAIEALAEGMQGKETLTDLFFETASGIKKEIAITKDYMIAVRLSVPPWPHADPDKGDKGMPIIGLIEDNMKHIFLTDVYKVGEDYLYAAGDGVIMKVTARGRTIQEARSRVYRTIDNLTIQDVQYRNDIGVRAEQGIKKLKQWGWLGDSKVDSNA